MIEIKPIRDFNLYHTLNCGQAFRWHEDEGWFYGVVDNRFLRISQENDTLCVESSDESNPIQLQQSLWHYFDLGCDLSKILDLINKDHYMDISIEACRGMRIMNQDLWECLGSFILSQNSNVPRIKQMIRNISKTFGNPVSLNGRTDYTFPAPEMIINGSVDQLFQCGLGYRSSYLFDAAVVVAEKQLDLVWLKSQPYLVAKQELMSLKGIGDKVAACVSLFSLGHGEALPIDVWVRKITERLYLKRKASKSQILEFFHDYFGEYIGYAQQYLFHYARTVGFKEFSDQ